MKVLVAGKEGALRGFRLAGAAVRAREPDTALDAVLRDAEAAGVGLVLLDEPVVASDAALLEPRLARQRPPFVEIIPAPGAPEQP